MRVTNTSSAGYSGVDIAKSNTGIVVDFANEVCVVKMRDGWWERKEGEKEGGAKAEKAKGKSASKWP